MPASIITPEDLIKFKSELLEDIKQLFTQRQTTPARQWLKSHEVRKMLGVSPGTLQNLRINGTLKFTKIGGVIFYDYDDIKAMMADYKRDFSVRQQRKNWAGV